MSEMLKQIVNASKHQRVSMFILFGKVYDLYLFLHIIESKFSKKNAQITFNLTITEFSKLLVAMTEPIENVCCIIKKRQGASLQHMPKTCE